VRLGLVSDIHGNAVALDAVLNDARRLGVERWWALGDLVLFGPRPVEVVEALLALPSVAFVQGNTDRYVVTGEQPRPHATAADAVGDVDLVERFGSMSAAIGWTRGALCQAGHLEWLARLPRRQSLELADGSALLGIHASPGDDDGPGIDTTATDDDLARLLAGCEADVVVGGHTHDATDRTIGDIRALNPGSVGLPRRCVGASWMLIEAADTYTRVEQRRVPFDVDEVVDDVHARRYPTAGFIEAILRHTHPFAH
jgi:predicted phosphodiesterase